MSAANIERVVGRRVWDSRGRPTVEAEIHLAGGAVGRAIAPAGASTGSGEALDLRDGGDAFGGLDVTRAVASIAAEIAPALLGLDAGDQAAVDARLIGLDGTPDKRRLGGNATIAVSMAAAHAAAAARGLPLWRHLGGDEAATLPMPEIQILGGGAHTAGRLDVQDFLIVCPGAESFAQALDWTAEVYRTAGRILAARGLKPDLKSFTGPPGSVPMSGLFINTGFSMRPNTVPGVARGVADFLALGADPNADVRQLTRALPPISLAAQFSDTEAVHVLPHPSHQTVDQSGYWLGEVAAVKHDSEPIYIWLSIGLIPVESARDQRFVVMISDITGIRETEKQFSQIAYYDSLTNLPNRMLIMDRLKQSIAQAARDSSLLGVLFIDLDNFKRINDTLGHNNGDTLLFFVSQKMQAVLRQSDTLGRLGGDEFIVIVTHVESHEGLIRVAEKIRESLASPIIIDNIEIVPSCSIGISLYPDHSIHSDELVQMADTAMYEAKNKGRNSFAFYHRSLTQKAAHHLTRERELYHALTQRQFRLHYQPQFSPSKQKITGVEALIRWQHPHKGLLSPAEIIPVAETSRLIIEIGNWVLTEACQQLSEWRDMGIDDLRIAVNLSIRQLADKNLMKFIADLLQQYAIPAHLLELEITESCLQDELLYINSLEQLDKQGIPISIDDFGTGYSCLSSLKNLPIQRLKIDKSFVQGIPEDSNDCAIASAIQVLAQKLGLQVIAEGIETMEQIHFLTQLGCDELQGYLLSKPVAPERIPEIIRTLPAELQTMTS